MAGVSWGVCGGAACARGLAVDAVAEVSLPADCGVHVRSLLSLCGLLDRMWVVLDVLWLQMVVVCVRVCYVCL